MRIALKLLAIFAILSMPLNAQNRRVIPLDVFLIIDASESLESSKNEVISWLNERVVDEILSDGDRITVWAAGDRATIIHSDIIFGNSSKNALRNSLRLLDTSGKSADFEGALKELYPRVSNTAPNRLSYTMLISSSAAGLEPVLSGETRSMLRWSRSERSERWQAFVIAPDIGPRVQRAAAEFMEGQGL